MKVHHIVRIIGAMAAVAIIALPLSLQAAPLVTATGTINATLLNKDGIAIVFYSDASGVTLGGTGTATATLNFGTISAYGTLGVGVTRPSVTATSFTVQTLFDIDVMSGATSPSYTLTSNLQAAAPTGLTYQVGTTTLTTTAQTLTTTGSYNTNVPFTLGLVVSTAAPGAGGPATGSALTTTIDFTATSN